MDNMSAHKLRQLNREESKKSGVIKSILTF